MAASSTLARPLKDDVATYQKLRLNFERNQKQDDTTRMELAADAFRYEDGKGEYWNPEAFSLLYGTPLWDEATHEQRRVLNHLYWVAYYSQIISAEIATIFFNQTCAAGLYGLEDFKLVCDMLDLESVQERAHIDAFQKVSWKTEAALFGERLFSYGMRSPYGETMVHFDSRRLRRAWKRWQLGAFALLSSGNAFIACQYFTVRALRTLNGKQVQHQLSQYYLKHPNREAAPIPSKISYYHFLDESFHFNSSKILSLDVVQCLRHPTPFERWTVNSAILGCQRDHFNFSSAINGIFWYDPALYSKIYRLLRSPIFGLDRKSAEQMMRRCFSEESEGSSRSFETHTVARESYRAFLTPLTFVSPANRDMAILGRNSLGRHLEENGRALNRFFRGLDA